MPDAMPGATLGHHVIALTRWFHYGLGITIDQIVDVLGYHLQTKLTPGGLIDAWRRLAEILQAWYEQVAEQARKSAHLHADETGWRVNGLTKRLRKYAEFIFTFLDYANVAFENNFAERQIRPAVILRKNSQSNRSEQGAVTQAVLMTVYHTLRLRGLNPTKTIADTLKTYLATGQLPPLPDTNIADG
ncbi:MAG: transposase [Phycisphaerae bacterium]